MADASRLVIWWLDDGKPGHRNQTLGLLDSLRRYRQVEAVQLTPLSPMQQLKCWLGIGQDTLLDKELNKPSHDCAPDLIVAAGRATQASLLSLGRRLDAPTLILMKPQLPIRWFGGAIVPEHDGVTSGQHVFVSKGALNQVVPGGEHNPAAGLMLLGGASRHYDWNDDLVLTQVKQLLADYPEIHWSLADSRRTPASLTAQLKNLGLDYYSSDVTDSTRLRELMAASGIIRVTPDSVSMVYEALTSGAQVGLFDLPANHPPSRVAAGIQALREQGLVTALAVDEAAVNAKAGVQASVQANVTDSVKMKAPPFWEADRAARWVLEHWGL